MNPPPLLNPPLKCGAGEICWTFFPKAVLLSHVSDDNEAAMFQREWERKGFFFYFPKLQIAKDAIYIIFVFSIFLLGACNECFESFRLLKYLQLFVISLCDKVK